MSKKKPYQSKGGESMKYKEEEEEYEDKDEDSIPEWQRGFFWVCFLCRYSEF